MTHGYLYRVTETNVDGCGTDAIEYVAFNRPLTETECARFQNALHEAKKNPELKTTWDMVITAVQVPIADDPSADDLVGCMSQTPFEGDFTF